MWIFKTIKRRLKNYFSLKTIIHTCYWHSTNIAKQLDKCISEEQISYIKYLLIALYIDLKRLPNHLIWKIFKQPYRRFVHWLNMVQYVELVFENCETMTIPGKYIKRFWLESQVTHFSQFDNSSSVDIEYPFDEGYIGIRINKNSNITSNIKHYDLLKSNKVYHISKAEEKRLNYRDITHIYLKIRNKSKIVFLPKYIAYDKESKENNTYTSYINLKQSISRYIDGYTDYKFSWKTGEDKHIKDDIIIIEWVNDKKALDYNKKEIKSFIKNKDWTKIKEYKY